MNEREKYATLQLGEIYVNPKSEYKAGKIIGNAENNVTSEEKTVEAFLIFSFFGKFKETFLYPVKNITACQLYDLPM